MIYLVFDSLSSGTKILGVDNLNLLLVGLSWPR